MLKYSYKCKCGHTDSVECARGKAPRSIKCTECEANMVRMINVADPANISAPDGQVSERDKTLRRNLKERRKKMNNLSEAEQKRFSEWSKKNSGGQW